MLLLSLAALLVLTSGPGLRWLTGLPWQGSLWTGVQLPAAEGEQDGWRWQVKGLRLAPLHRSEGLWQLELGAERLELSRAAAAPVSPAPKLADVQAQLAELAALPAFRATLELSQLHVQGLALEGLQLALESRATGLQLQLPALLWQGTRWRGLAELQPDARLVATLNAQRERLGLKASLQGPLNRLGVQAQLQDGTQRLLDLEASLDSLAVQPLKALQARWERLDPQRLHAQAPAGLWQGSAHFAPEPAGAASERLRIELDTENRAARRLDEDGWPLRRLQLRAALDPAQWQALELQALALELGNTTQGAGRLELAAPQGLPQPGEALQTRLRLVGLRPDRLKAGWPDWPVEGQLALRQEAAPAGPASPVAPPLHWQLALSSPATRWRAQGEGSLQGRRLQVADLQLGDGSGRLQARAEAELLPQGWRLEAQAQAQELAAVLPPWSAPSRISGRLTARWQQRSQGHQGEIDLQLNEGSQLAGLPLAGSLRWAPGQGSAPWQLQLQGDGLALQAEGDSAEPGQALRDLDRLRRASTWLPREASGHIQELARLAPLWRPWAAQVGELAGRVQGRWQAEGQSLRAELEGMRWQAKASGGVPVALQRAELDWQGASGRLLAQGVRYDRLQLRELSASLGLDTPLRFQANGSWQQSADAEPVAWQSSGRSGAAQVGEDGARRWPDLQLAFGPREGVEPWLRLHTPELRWQGTPSQPQLRLAPGTLTLVGESLALQAAQWQAGAWQLALEGRARWRPWLALLDRRAAHADALWLGDASSLLRLRAEQREGERAPQLDLRLADLQGDLQLDGQALGLQALALHLRLQTDGSAGLQAQLRSALLGELQSDLQLGAGSEGALAGQLQLRLPRFSALRPWLPLGLHAEGEAELQARLMGTRGAPQFQGSASAQLASLRHAGTGFAARQGRLVAAFDLNRLQVRELSLLGAGEDGGRLQAEGSLEWQQGAPRARLQALAERLRVLGRFDRRLVLSGQSRLELDGRRLRLDGQLRADEGFFEVGRPEAPGIDEDVRVVDDAAPPPEPGLASRWRREVDLKLDLGERLRVQGRGFASRLTGQLQLKESGGQPWQLHGLIETQGGRYKAYGQNLDIESGELRFSGAPSNPRLNLLAIKPDIEHRVGVSVTGSLEQPRVRLFAEPELSDNDKLAWLLLGRDPQELAARDTALLQRAALALLAGEGESAVGRLMDSLGLTEFSVSQGEDAGTVLRLGARLSKRWSVGYERSLNATSGSWQLVYRLGQRFRLRAQSGVESAVDLLWLRRFD
ncbi:translocation/assembly module TamB domain-containing protein [Inhella sp.]|uniref:translocation/assembly module TamB domain-containing protein n=1 Tax=Inhella sp. TaxID=1921806 RepID=UPI0035B3A39F